MHSQIKFQAFQNIAKIARTIKQISWAGKILLDQAKH